MHMLKTKLLLELEDRIRSAGLTVSARSWEDDSHAFACSVESCGPATYGHPKLEFCERRKTPLQTTWPDSIGN